jgi:hypothetical protein
MELNLLRASITGAIFGIRANSMAFCIFLKKSKLTTTKLVVKMALGDFVCNRSYVSGDNVVH